VIDRPKEPPTFGGDDDEEDFDDPFGVERPTSPAEAMPEERPTVSPPFDVEAYARASEAKVRAARTPAPAVIGGEVSTKPPPPSLDFEPEEEFSSADRPRPPQITLTDEGEIEEARLRSVLIPSDLPPRRRISSRPNVGDDEGPATVAYPAEYERDPFARLNEKPSDAPDPGRALKEMHDRFSLGDYTGALELAEALLQGAPDDATREDALDCAEECRAKLIQMYAARIGPLDRVPTVMVAAEQLRWLSIDHRAGFLLSHIDGVSNLEMILDVSGMPLLDALKILCELVQQHVITMR
jgi:hypothetical protein